MSFLKTIFIIWYFILFVVTSLLVAEYSYFKSQNNSIKQVKQDYKNTILSLKSLIKYYENLNLKLKKKVDLLEFEPDKIKLLSEKPSETLNNLESKTSSVVTKSNNRWKKFQKKEVFKWPIKSNQYWISSVYGPRRRANGKYGFHHGIDMAAIKGTPVYAALSGTVIECCYIKGYGKTIVIKHDYKLKKQVFKTRYAHLSKILVKKGQKVKTGQKIGKVGDTGFVRKEGTDASHLHFEVYLNNKRVNPFYFLA